MSGSRGKYAPWIVGLVALAVLVPVALLSVGRSWAPLRGISARAAYLAGLTSGGAHNMDHPVLAFYYPWYDPGSFGNASDQPATQPYESDDPKLIAQQVDQAQAAGVDGFICAWFGKEDRTNKNLGTLLDVAKQKGFSATIYFETDHFLPWGPQDIAEQLGNFYQEHLDNPALVRYQGKPVIFFWRTSALDAGTWAGVRAQVDPGHRAVWIAEGDKFDQLNGDTFDGIHPYSIAWSKNPAGTLATYGQRTHAHSGKLWVPTAMPGYDDTRLGRGAAGFAVARNDGAFYRASFEGAIASKPDWAILITSWNEWLEGHQIEPSASYGNLYLGLTSELVGEFRGQVASTASAGG